MNKIIETRLTRPSQITQHSLANSEQFKLVDIVVDFDALGKTAFTTEELVALCKKWSISPNMNIVVTEAGGTFCSARIAFTLLVSGFQSVELVQPESLEKETTSGNVFDKDGLNHILADGFISKEEVLAAIENRHQIVDVRNPERFVGLQQDHRPGVRSGHIPTSTNIHYSEFLSEDTGSVFKPVEKLKSLFEHAKIELTQPVIFSCGSGITACIGAVAAMKCGAKKVSVYDGS